MTDNMSAVSDYLTELGRRVRGARLDRGLDVQTAAADAGVARGTWAKVEKGESVQDVKRSTVLNFLGLDHTGAPVVGGDTQHGQGYVESPGTAVDAAITNEDLYREILRSRADYDQLRSEVRQLSERVDKVEQPGS